MPELPEVETIRRRLEPLLSGRKIVRVEINDPRLTRPVPANELAAGLSGERIEVLDRRGKYLLVRLESGLTLVIHLRMTGSLRHRRAGAEQVAHERARLELDDGSELAYRDVRRFGTWHLLTPDALEEYLDARVGPERLAGRRAPLKAALLDQRTLAGLGNIYVDEALWRAKLHPTRPAASLGKPALVRLYDAIRKTLEIGIARQGSTLRDYALPDGESGSMQAEFRVYGREGEPCERCGTAISKTRIAGRGTWFCPRCQRRR